MDDDPDTAVFFDIGDTLASVTVSPDGRIELTAFPFVPGVLAALHDRGARLGILSDRGPFPEDEVNRALDDAGLRHFLDPELVIYGRKDSTAIFERAAATAGTARLVFVGENPAERAHAVQAGFLVAPHPLQAVSVLDEQGPPGP